MQLNSVSTSAAYTFGVCRRRSLYSDHPAYNLEPKAYGFAISRGVMGHEILEAFFKHYMKTQDHKGSVKVAHKKMADLMQKCAKELPTHVPIVTELVILLKDYFDSPGLLSFLDQVIILDVEYRIDVQLTPDINLPGRIDLIVKYVKGLKKGYTVPVDHKFVYNFWKEDDFRMNAQFPNYIFALRSDPRFEGAIIKEGIVNMLRHRENAVEKFSMVPIEFSRYEIQQLVDNHVKLAREVALFKALPKADAEEAATRTLSKYNCGNCSYKSLCKSQLTGGNSADLIKMEYQPNSYGYDKENSDDV